MKVTATQNKSVKKGTQHTHTYENTTIFTKFTNRSKRDHEYNPNTAFSNAAMIFLNQQITLPSLPLSLLPSDHLVCKMFMQFIKLKY